MEDEYTYTYDYNFNRTTRANALQSSLSEAYAYDGLDRLVDTDRNSSNFQDWTLDSLGNWRSNTTAAGTQARTASKANEIGTITGTGVDWIDPVYDAAGNMTSGPRSDAPTTRIHFVYDAWNRLMEVKAVNGSGAPGSSIETYEYDGVNRRITQSAGGNAKDSYYNENWQLLEVRLNGDSDPIEQYVWDLSYIDAPAIRFYDSNVDGDYVDASDSTLYYTFDANMNVTGLVDPSTGNVVERVSYTSYGTPTFYNASWVGIGTSGKANDILFGGYRYDSNTGQLHVRNRYLNSALGQWSQRDKVGYVDGYNLGEYVSGNSIQFIDPYGLRKESAEETKWIAKMKQAADEAGSAAEKSQLAAGRPADQAKAYGSKVRDAMRKAAAEMEAEIANVPAGKVDSNSLKTALWAIGRWFEQDPNYNKATPTPKVLGAGPSAAGEGKWKCNAFVSRAWGVGGEIGWIVFNQDRSVYAKSKTQQGYSESGFPLKHDPNGPNWPPMANDLADKGTKLKNFPVTGDIRDTKPANRVVPKPGDIVSFPSGDASSGHTTIAVGSGAVISAHEFGIGFEAIDQVYPDRPAIVRTYKPN